MVYEGLHGDTYNSLLSLSKAYAISYGALRKKVNLGMATQDAIRDIMVGKSKVKDHMENEFDSVIDMCKYWGKEYNTYRSRISMGWSVEQALTTPLLSNKVVCRDHLNNEYKSLLDMCKTYGISTNTYRYRKEQGWSLEKILTTPISDHTKYCKDHLGKEYKSVVAMCKAYNITPSVYKNRLKLGWSLEKTLTTPIKNVENIRDKNGVKDHLNNCYPNIGEMCKAYNRSVQTFYHRLRRGMSLKEALTGEADHSNKIPDGFGNNSYNMVELASKYNISYNTLYTRLKYNVEPSVALIVNTDKVQFAFLGLDGKARYMLNRYEDKLYTARELIAKYRPDLISAYDKHNPTGKYEPYKGGNINARQ